jgi:hypothetical protein
MIQAIAHITNVVSSFFFPGRETEEQKYRIEMARFLNQATDRYHLEYLEREWERMHGRRYW